MSTKAPLARCFSVHKILMGGLAILIFDACQPDEEETTYDPRLFEKAALNAEQAHEGFVRSDAYMRAWLEYADSRTKLIPRNLYDDSTIWNGKDAAADNYPFMVLTSFFTDQDLYQGVMREMLENETQLTSRVKSMPDTYSFVKQDFEDEEVAMERVLFGTSEYIKDGLLPLSEWLGKSPWSERMVNMLRDMDEYIDVAGGFGDEYFGSAPEAEVNGELLQILSRIYWMTGEQKFLDWAIQIGDYYLLEEKYPLTDFDYLRLRDHGCELISGLCELYVTLHFADQGKKNEYQERLHGLLDYILMHGRNEDGLFYNAINPQTNEVVDEQAADTWGYTLNGYYAVYMVDSVEAYKEAVDKVFANLSKYQNFDWERGSADGYADAIESALNLYNRIPDERAARWIDSEIKVMWAMQDSSHREGSEQWKGSGIIEGWHGDGNFARTTIMHNLWKSQGTYVQPWNDAIRLGAEQRGDTLFIVLRSSSPWEGKLYFDQARHNNSMNLPVDWPRINQFPEWFTVDPEQTYQWIDGQAETSEMIGGESLLEGVPVSLPAGEKKYLMVVQ
ncbi:hypothetical protein OKW21_005378 [Catalinimonas alkaloidigena]|uniref:hypothetical protein n=1 Tax=Catalinimonas alkaloidigena TaxID=1075417 RepID=UPI0024070BFD|nr:hypothetical protein [Catalinimonas alkaloidigena]MDF9800115.1 hypothetical protein [Catalinimonas alkaloidigena]